MKIKRKLEKLLNTFYWIINVPFGIIVVNSWMTQKWNKIIPNNIGDDINYYLIKALSGRPVVNYRDIYHKRIRIKNYLCIGSVIDWMTNSDTIIWGSGVMYGKEAMMKRKPLKVCAVRGPLTRDYLLSQGICCPEIYGDPALLLPLVYKCNVKKKYKLGIIPHFYDYNSVVEKKILPCNGLYTVINISHYKDWKSVIDQINECELIASSSLHGLILSDAYRIPNVWIQLSDKMKGGNFKFHDYFKSVNRPICSPIDLRNNSCIDCDAILNLIESYQLPIISVDALLQSCPFHVRERYLNMS